MWQQKFMALVILFFISLIFFHELTHVALNDFRIKEPYFCVFNCNPMSSGNYTPFGVYLSEPKNVLAENEVLAWISSSVIAASIVLLLGKWRKWI